MLRKALNVKTPHGGTEKPNTDHNQRNTRGMKSVDLLAGSSEAKEFVLFNCNDCKKQFIQMTPRFCVISAKMML